MRSAACSSFFHRPFGQKLHAVGEEAEDELVDEMRDRLAVGIAVLQAVGNRLELVGGFLGQLGPRAPRAQFVRIVEDGAEAGEVDRLGEVLELELVDRRDFVGPARLDAKDVRVAGDMQRRILERRGVAGQLFERLAEIALLLLVLPGEKALLPDVGPSFAAAGFRRALFEREMIADRVASMGVGWSNSRQRSMKCSCAVARSVSATGFHLRMKSCGVIDQAGRSSCAALRQSRRTCA